MNLHLSFSWQSRSLPELRFSTSTAAALCAAVLSIPANAGGKLPVPCSPCSVTSGAPVSFGGNATSNGTTMTVVAGTTAQPNVTLNWQSFNISTGNSVNFVQPSSTAIALNQIYQSSPSQIFGNLTANGQIYLINPNGIIFGDPSGAPVQVNTHGLIASSLQISADAVTNGILDPNQQNGASFSGNTGFIQVNSGAQLTTDNGGRIALFAPTLTNQGQISSPNGQVILAAGQSVYLQASDDPNLRGLLVEVDGGGSVTNAGSILSTTGNISLLGLAVNQQGRVTATTSVTEAGSIYLTAGDTQTFQIATGGQHTATPTHTGAVDLAPGSVTEVTLDTGGATTLDDQPQPQSLVSVLGGTIHLEDGSSIVAPGSVVRLTAQSDPALIGVQPNNPAVSIQMDSGSDIDVSGGSVTVPMSRNQVDVQLRGNELADSPLQRNGILQGQTVTVDARTGTPLADVSGYIEGATERTVAERLGAGGTVDVVSDGSVNFASGSKINVSGGAVNYTAGYVATTELMANGALYNIGSAPENIVYNAIVDAAVTTPTTWGLQTTAATAPATYFPAYVQGQSAGTVQIAGGSLQIAGNIVAQTQSGPYQRTAATSPAGGTLIIGQAAGVSSTGSEDFDAPSLMLQVGAPINGLTNNTASIPVGQYSSEGVSNFDLYSNGSITLPSETPLALAAGGSLVLTGQQVTLNSNVTAPSGVISATAAQLDPSIQLVSTSGVAIGDDVQLNVAGTWVNDLNNSYSSVPLYTSGGRISLASAALTGTLSLGSNVLLDAQSGAWDNSSGIVTGGNGGTISLAATGLGSILQIGSGTELRGFGVAQGGTLSITAPSLTIAPEAASETTSLVFDQPQTATRANALVLGADVFQQGGFSQYNIGTSDGNLTVASGAAVNVETATRTVNSGYPLQPTGANVDAFSTVQYLPAYAQTPAGISLSVNPISPVGETDNLLVQSGSSITTLPGGHISATTHGGSIDIEGDLVAKGGTITLSAAQSGSQSFDPTFGLWLGPGAVLDTSGTTVNTPLANGTSQVNVLAGGPVSLSSSGYLVTQAGSLINVNGTSTLVDVVANGVNNELVDNPGNNTSLVGSDAGSVSLAAGEGILLDGNMQAAAGATGYYGGTLSVELSRSLRTGQVTGGVPAFPTLPTAIDVAQTVPQQVGVAFGTALNTSFFDGKATIATTQITQSGFDSVSLQSDNLINFTGTTPVNFTLGRQLTLNAPVIQGLAGVAAVQLSAPSLTFESLSSRPVGSATNGSATFQANGVDIDVAGATVFSGFNSVSLNSSGDIRLLGVNGQGGALATVGTLNLQANRIYPESMTPFSISVADTPTSEGTINILGGSSAAASDPVLSVGGQLTLSASIINQNGVLEAPLGSINLDASDSLTLGPTSLTSVQLNANEVLLGSTVNETDWYYSFFGANDLTTSDQIFGATTQAFPIKQISLNGKNVVVDPGAVVDIAGGGDVIAYEQIPGPGGTTDVLSLANAGNMFAIIPLQSGFGPIDPSEFAGWNIPAGTEVTLDQGADGLAAGTYAILPPRYALLPGAFLITPTGGYANMNTSQTVALSDGGIVVPGTEGMLGTGLHSGNVSGFIVQPGSYAYQLAQYNITGANAYLPTRATQLGLPVPQLPMDAGTLNIAGQGALQLNGTFQSAPQAGGQGAQVNITAANLEVVGSLDGNTAATEITAANLDNLGANSILLGGTRSFGADGNSLTAQATSVSLGAGVSLNVPELILIGTNSVVIGNGATINANGSVTGATTNYLLSGDSAFVLASATKGVSVTRSYPSGVTAGETGVVTADAGSSINASGSVIMDGSKDLTVAGDLTVAQGGTLALSSSLISLGDGNATGGLLLDSSELAQFQGLDVTLTSRSAIDFLSPVTLQASALTLDAASLQGDLSGSTGAVTVAATGTLTLQNSSGNSAAAIGATTGDLNVQAGTLVLNSGAINADGFSRVNLTGSGMIVGKGNASLTFQGDLTATAPLVTVADGGQLAIASAAGTGNVQFASNGAAPSVNPYLGGALSVVANTIEQDGNLAVDSGAITLAGTNGVELGAGSYTGAPGEKVAMPGFTAYSPAGSVSLSSDSGNIHLDAGATVDVSGAAAGGDAGELSLTAANGTLYVDPAATLHGASSGGSAKPANVAVDTGALNGVSFSALNTMLNTGGFAGQRSFEFSSATPSIDIDAGTVINSSDFQLVVDQGSVNVNGTINAVNPIGTSTAYIAASGNITVGSSGVIDVSSGATSATASEIDLFTGSGGITTDTGAVLSVSAPNATDSAGGGLIHYRLGRSALAANEFINNATVIGSPQQIVEGYQAYNVANGVVSSQVAASASNPIYESAVQFMGSAAVTSLKTQGYEVLPGVELDTAQDMQINSVWNLAGWRFGGLPGFLTLRAGGSIDVNASISDGFASAVPTSALRADDSWSLSLAAGANLGSADPLSVSANAASGSVVVAPDTLIRTGTGDISIAAAQDVVLSGSVSPDDPYGQAVVYTAGRDAGLELDHASNPRNASEYVPIDGGTLSLNAGGDIIGSPSDNEFTDTFVEWYERQPAQANQPAGMWINYAGFQQDFAAFGGGDLNLTAGGSIIRVGASVPTTASFNSATQITTYYGKGSLTVMAGADVDSGMFLVGDGTGVIRAGGSLTATSEGPFGGNSLGTVLAAMNSQFTVESRGDITLDTVLDPTLIGQINPSQAQTDYFMSYSPNSSVSLTSVAGQITLQNNSNVVLAADVNEGAISQLNSYDLQIYPGSFSATALGGSINIEGQMYFAPTPNAALMMAAQDSIVTIPGFEVAQSDIDPAMLPGLGNAATTGSPTFLNAIYDTTGSLAHADPPLHADDPSQAVLVAATGDISGGIWSIDQTSFIFAGQDISNLRLNLQNDQPNQVTQVLAGRDITLGNNITAGIDIEGPGELDVVAGRNTDLGQSYGIVSDGNLVNLGLPAGGANLTVMAGVSADLNASLAQLPTTPQLLDLFSLLDTTGKNAVAGLGDFSAGYGGISALFPSSPGLTGDLSMIYSHIYTLDGGDINIVVPNGSVDVGVAQASTTVGIQKPPYELGIVAEQSGSIRALVDGDFLVNSSRVFTLGGGNILIWSSNGNIDAGRGAKTTISAPPPTISIDSQGDVTQDFGAAVAGSGIRGILTVTDVPPGDVDLFAPRGFVIAGDAGIGSAGNITIGALAVIGAGNINFGGTAAGVPIDTGGLGASLAGVSAVSSGASNSMTQSAEADAARQQNAPLADSALSWLDVFVTGLGDENCRPEDTDCLKRQSH